MASIKNVAIALMGLMGIAQAAPSPGSTSSIKTLTDGNKTYNIVDVEWNLRVNNTMTMTVTGTVEDGIARLAELNPEAAAALNAHASSTTFTRLDRRDQYSPTVHYCNIFEDATCDVIITGINYLRWVPGAPGMPPGPGNCGRVSCSYNSAIYWCNDNTEPIKLQDFSRIADGAQDIMDLCSFEQTPLICVGDFNGQQFFEGGYNVIVKKDSC